MATRAIVTFVPDDPVYLAQHRILWTCWRENAGPDTDYVCFGPPAVRAKLQDGVRFIEHPDRKLAYKGYGFANSLDCLAGPGAKDLERYDHILKTDTDVFLTPAFKTWRPEGFTVGQGRYVNDRTTRENLLRVAAEFGLTHRGLHNIGATWHGPTAQVLAVGRLVVPLMKYFITVEFARRHGAWPGWYRGVSSMYASEIAINHLIDAVRIEPDQLDFPSTSGESVEGHAHIHCWHTDQLFSKRHFQVGLYQGIDLGGLDTTIVKAYCLHMAMKEPNVA